MTDGDADLAKSPIYPLLNSFPKVVSSVSSVTMVWVRGVGKVQLLADSQAYKHVGLQPAGLALVGPCLPPDAYLDTPNAAAHLP